MFDLIRKTLAVLERILRPGTLAYALGPGHGKDTVFKIDDSGGTLRDISPYVDSINFPGRANPPDITGMGASAAGWRQFMQGLRGATVEIGGVFDDTATVGSAVVLPGAFLSDTSKSVEYGPLGSATGRPKLSAESFVTSLDIISGVDDAVRYRATVQVTGAVTIGVW